jgi:hypothetical protein
MPTQRNNSDHAPAIRWRRVIVMVGREAATDAAEADGQCGAPGRVSLEPRLGGRPFPIAALAGYESFCRRILRMLREAGDAPFDISESLGAGGQASCDAA